MGEIIESVRAAFARIRERGDDGVWIALVPEDDALRAAAALESGHHPLPLRGRTFAVKDNIDVAGLPTTAACPAFSRTPEGSAHVVRKLLEAGAIVIGKTNLDQFATGLNGTRTPHTIPRNAFDPERISGGSSSGSAIAVAAGLVDFALGTDTAGSGRVPAAFNNLVGFKPTRGRWSTDGLLPACRTLDCITVLARTVGEALSVDEVVKGFDRSDPYSRHEEGRPASGRRVAVLADGDREFFGDRDYARLYEAAIDHAREAGWSVGEFDYAPFLEAASLLYAGPWVAERYAAIRNFIETQPEAIHPVVRKIIDAARAFSAADAFDGQYRLAALARKTTTTWSEFDALLLPSAPTLPTIDDMLADPVGLNAKLGRYTNFMNLLDLCGIAVPAGFTIQNPSSNVATPPLPFGITLVAPAWSENLLFAMAAEFGAIAK